MSNLADESAARNLVTEYLEKSDPDMFRRQEFICALKLVGRPVPILDPETGRPAGTVCGYRQEDGEWISSGESLITPVFFRKTIVNGELECRMELIVVEDTRPIVFLRPLFRRVSPEGASVRSLEPLCIVWYGTDAGEMRDGFNIRLRAAFWNIDDFFRRRNPTFLSGLRPEDRLALTCAVPFSGRIIDQAVRKWAVDGQSPFPEVMSLWDAELSETLSQTLGEPESGPRACPGGTVEALVSGSVRTNNWDWLAGRSVRDLSVILDRVETATTDRHEETAAEAECALQYITAFILNHDWDAGEQLSDRLVRYINNRHISIRVPNGKELTPLGARVIRTQAYLDPSSERARIGLRLIEDADPTMRVIGIEILGICDCLENIGPISAHQSDPAEEVRAAVYIALAKIADVKPGLLVSLLDPTENVREEYIGLLIKALKAHRTRPDAEMLRLILNGSGRMSGGCLSRFLGVYARYCLTPIDLLREFRAAATSSPRTHRALAVALIKWIRRCGTGDCPIPAGSLAEILIAAGTRYRHLLFFWIARDPPDAAPFIMRLSSIIGSERAVAIDFLIHTKNPLVNRPEADLIRQHMISDGDASVRLLALTWIVGRATGFSFPTLSSIVACQDLPSPVLDLILNRLIEDGASRVQSAILSALAPLTKDKRVVSVLQTLKPRSVRVREQLAEILAGPEDVSLTGRSD